MKVLPAVCAVVVALWGVGCSTFVPELSDSAVTADVSGATDDTDNTDADTVDDTPLCLTDADCAEGDLCQADGRCVRPAAEGETCHAYFYDCAGEDEGCAYDIHTPCAAGLFCDESTSEEWGGQLFCRQWCQADDDCPTGRICAPVLATNALACVVPAAAGDNCSSEVGFDSGDGEIQSRPCQRGVTCLPDSETCAMP